MIIHSPTGKILRARIEINNRILEELYSDLSNPLFSLFNSSLFKAFCFHLGNNLTLRKDYSSNISNYRLFLLSTIDNFSFIVLPCCASSFFPKSPMQFKCFSYLYHWTTSIFPWSVQKLSSVCRSHYHLNTEFDNCSLLRTFIGRRIFLR